MKTDTTNANPRATVRLLKAQSSRFNLPGKIENKREESRFNLMLKNPANLPRIFAKAIQPVLHVIPENGQIGIRVTGLSRAAVPALLTGLSGKWKWTAFEDDSFLLVPRAEEMTEEHVNEITEVIKAQSGVKAGFGAVVRK